MFEQKLPSNHIRLAPYTHVAYERGDPVLLASGNVIAISDGNYEADASISVTVGRPVIVSEVPRISGTNPGAAIYADSLGALSTTSSGKFYGFIVENTVDSSRIANIGV